MNIGDFTKLRWLRMVAVNDLSTEEYDLVMHLSERYLESGEIKVFTDEELRSLDDLYRRLKELHDSGRITHPVEETVSAY